MTYIMHFHHGSRLSWNRDFLKLDDKTGEVSSVRLNLLQRILRLTLGSLASWRGISAFYAHTIFSQKRITPFERTRNSAVAAKIETLVRTLNCCGKKLSYRPPHFNPFDHPSVATDSPGNNVQEEDAKTQNIAKLRDFFPTPIPKDMAVLLLSWLDFKDVVRMRQVNKSWHQLIVDSTKSLTKRFVDSCYTDITELLVNTPTKNQGVIFRGFMNLLKSLVKYDIEATKKTVIIAKQKASTLDKLFENYLLREIAKVEAVYAIDLGKQTAATITEETDRESAIFHISLYIEKDIPRAKELALAEGGIIGDYRFLDIIKLEAETDIASAQETLQLIQDLDVRNRAKIEIIKRLAPTDMPAAKRLTAELENPRFRFEAELVLGQHEPEHNFQPAIATALKIEDGEENRQQKALADIAVIQNNFDKNGAQKTLALMKKNSFHKNWALNEFDKQEAPDNMSTAMEHVILTVQDFRFQLILLKHMAQKNMWEAKTVAHSFQDLEERTIALRELAEFALKQNKKS